LLPVMSVASLILIVGSLAVPVAVLGGFTTGAAGDDPSTGTMLGALLFYVIAYFITLFFNTALVGAAMMRMDGHDPRLSDGLRIAWERVGRIFLYACIAATVGMILRAIEERVGWLGQLVVKLIGVGWALATFLVVPSRDPRRRTDRGGEGQRQPAAPDVGENIIATSGSAWCSAWPTLCSRSSRCSW